MKNLFRRSRRKEAQAHLRFTIYDLRFWFGPRYLGCHGILLLLALICAGNLLAADVVCRLFSRQPTLRQRQICGSGCGLRKNPANRRESPSLLFNDGNAEFKAGNLGKAIAAYRQAELLAPRDAELRANLAFVRNQVQGATVRESPWQKWIGSLSLNEGAVLTAVLFWLMSALFIARQIQSGARAETADGDAHFCHVDDFFRRSAGGAGGESF